ncbi:MAG TPA: VWA domain-containing protein [Candidatus Acidoferrales bacterium]|nr:VWA domain-containing protein [Candidatus Acidoferrales bacterium]
MRLTRLVAGFFTLALAGYCVAGGASPADGTSWPALLAATPQSPAPPQQGQQQPAQSPQTLKRETNLVNVFVTARDKKNGIISDLTQNDFKVSEDGQPQEVAFFSKEVNMPITLGLLIDTSGSMYNVIGAEQDTASRFLREVMRKKDEAMVISFDFDADLLADFTEDTNVLERAIRRTTVNSVGGGGVVTPGTIPQGNNSGGTNLYDAVYLACHDELATEAGRKAVILMTDAEDNGSKLRLQDAVEACQRADSVIHVLLISDSGFYQGFGGGPGVARKMSDDTGGRVINVHNEKTLEKAFDVISEELRSQYVIGYYPTNDKHDGTFRKIKVDISRPDVKVLARRGYYAPFK